MIVTVLSGVMKMQSCLLAEPEMAEADLLIAPEIAVPSMSSREARERVIQAGYDTASVSLRHWRPNAASGKPQPPRGAAVSAVREAADVIASRVEHQTR
ncbi:MAG TPA: hypothetical protein VGN91_25425 [Bosea sp. (in: a-proteobacteria)]|nr:hypothetical protein [Bosea sp. (in: a-proteobacteria)]